MTSTTSKSSIKPPPVIVEESTDEKVEEVAVASEPVSETKTVNGTTEGMN